MKNYFVIIRPMLRTEITTTFKFGNQELFITVYDSGD